MRKAEGKRVFPDECPDSLLYGPERHWTCHQCGWEWALRTTATCMNYPCDHKLCANCVLLWNRTNEDVHFAAGEENYNLDHGIISSGQQGPQQQGSQQQGPQQQGSQQQAPQQQAQQQQGQQERAIQKQLRQQQQQQQQRAAQPNQLSKTGGLIPSARQRPMALDDDDDRHKAAAQRQERGEGHISTPLLSYQASGLFSGTLAASGSHDEKESLPPTLRDGSSPGDGDALASGTGKAPDRQSVGVLLPVSHETLAAPTLKPVVPLLSSLVSPLEDLDDAHTSSQFIVSSAPDPHANEVWWLRKPHILPGTRAASSVSSPRPTALVLEKADFTDELPFTDSGYASARDPRRPNGASRPYGDDPLTAAGKELAEDVRTIYSDATSVAPGDKLGYILELTDDICSKLRDTGGYVDLPMMLRTLPDLTKAFAIRLGLEQDSEVSRRAMYFIHRHHKEILSKVQNVLAEEEYEESLRSSSESMSLSDKMSMWGRSISAGDLCISHKELFEGVDDEEEDEVTDTPELSSYKDLVFKSEAYRWFIAAVRRDVLGRGSAARLMTMIDGIRHRVLAELQTGTISKRKVPNKYVASFRVLLPAVVLRSSGEAGWQKSAAEEDGSLTHRVIITRSSEATQASTLKEYFSQTWPVGGVDFLRLVEEAIKDGGRPVHSAALHVVDVAARVQDEHLLVSCSGPAYSIAECGEQLALLAAALHAPEACRFAYITASVSSSARSLSGVLNAGDVTNHRASLSSNLNSTLAETQAPHGQPAVAFQIEVQATSPAHSPSQSAFWRHILRLPLARGVVYGFPTRHRPVDAPGLELPFDILAAVLGIDSTPTSPTARGKAQDPAPSVAVNLLKNAYGRSIRLGRFLCLELTSWDADIFHWHIVDPSGSPKTCSCRGARPTIPTCPNDIELRRGRHVIMECCGLPEQDEDCGASLKTSTSITDQSLSSDYSPLLSDSSYTERTNQQWRPFRLLQRVFRELPLEFTTTQNEGGADLESEIPPMPQETSGMGQAPILMGPPGTLNRKLRERDDEDDENEGASRPPKRSRVSIGPSRTKSLACPFYKLDPVRNSGCFFKKLDKIARVKQHLDRQHTPRFFCTRCFAIFKRDDDLRRHSAEVQCVCLPGTKLCGVSPNQARLLKRSSRRYGSVEEHWYAMWDVLFPGQRHPSSIWVDADQSEDFATFRAFAQRQGIVVLRSVLLATSMQARQGVTETQIDDALQRGINAMLEDFDRGRSNAHLQQRRASPSTDSAIPPSGAPRTSPQTPPLSTTNSSSAVGAHQTPSSSEPGSANTQSFQRSDSSSSGPSAQQPGSLRCPPPEDQRQELAGLENESVNPFHMDGDLNGGQYNWNIDLLPPESPYTMGVPEPTGLPDVPAFPSLPGLSDLLESTLGAFPRLSESAERG